MLRRLFAILIAILAGGASTARGQISTLGKYGLWEAFGGVSDSGSPVCGISHFGQDGRGFLVKYFSPQDTLVIQIAKKTWTIPNGTKIRLRIQFDKNNAWVATATGYNQVVELFVPLSEANQFLNELRWSNQIRIWFLDGNEGGWSGGLLGSNAAVEMMSRCLGTILNKGQIPSQPYDKTQPYNRSQPFSIPPVSPAPPNPQPHSSPMQAEDERNDT